MCGVCVCVLCVCTVCVCVVCVWCVYYTLLVHLFPQMVNCVEQFIEFLDGPAYYQYKCQVLFNSIKLSKLLYLP